MVLGRKVRLTTLFNRTLPFIRYELSDLVTIAEGPCPVRAAPPAPDVDPGPA